MVIPHIKAFATSFKCLNQFWVSVTEIVGAAVKVQINQTMAIHVVKVIPLTPINDQIDPHVLPILGLARVPKRSGSIEKL